MITFASESVSVRKQVKDLCAEVLKIETARIIDIGGTANTWLLPHVTHIMDIQKRPLDLPSAITYIQADINDKESWEKIPDNFFDFASCTHTLEDIRDPGFVLNQISRIAKRGFIAIPNRHQEMSRVESKSYNGWSHHRWLFNFDGEKMLITPKFGPLWIPRKVEDDLLSKMLNLRNAVLKDWPYLRLKRFISESLPKQWINSSLRLTSTGHEASFIWETIANYKYWNGDYAGENLSELQSNALEFLTLEFVEMGTSEYLGSNF